jgi:hypothetical protein
MHRCIQYFDHFNTIWLQLAKEVASGAYAAYARRTASMYGELSSRVQKALNAVGLPTFIKPGDGKSLVDVVLAWRQAENDLYFKEVNYWYVSRLSKG